VKNPRALLALKAFLRNLRAIALEGLVEDLEILIKVCKGLIKALKCSSRLCLRDLNVLKGVIKGF
jgi:hypothetical protein